MAETISWNTEGRATRLVGITGEMVRAAWGPPREVNTTYTADHIEEQWLIELPYEPGISGALLGPYYVANVYLDNNAAQR